MIRYADGSDARPGDRVDLDGWAGVVEEVLDDAKSLARWDLDEPGLMIRTVAAGMIFEPAAAVGWEALRLLGRAEPGGSGRRGDALDRLDEET